MADIDLHIHPMVVHFPIALFMSALVLEILSLILKKDSLHQTAKHLYVLAAIVTPLVVKTGLWEADELHIHHPVLALHRKFALLTMWIALVSLPALWLFQKKIANYFRLVFLIFLVVIVSSLSIAAYNGGRLVYEYGVGVENE